MNDQTARMGFQIGKSAVMAGQEYVDQSVGDPPRQKAKSRSCILGADRLPSNQRSTATSPSQP